MMNETTQSALLFYPFNVVICRCRCVQVNPIIRNGTYIYRLNWYIDGWVPFT
jgi:hypothetical protein